MKTAYIILTCALILFCLFSSPAVMAQGSLAETLREIVAPGTGTNDKSKLVETSKKSKLVETLKNLVSVKTQKKSKSIEILKDLVSPKK